MKVLNEQDRLFRSRLTTLFVFFFNRYYEYLLVLLASHDLIYIYNDAVADITDPWRGKDTEIVMKGGNLESLKWDRCRWMGRGEER